jgi:hypothetical protein
MGKTAVRGAGVLSRYETEKLQQRLGIVPRNLNGFPYRTRVRRGEIERRRLSLIKHDTPAPGMLESQELYRVCRYQQEEETLHLVAWAIRSRITGDYFVFAEEW